MEADYLEQVGKPGRTLAIVCLAVSSLLFGTASLFNVVKIACALIAKEDEAKQWIGATALGCLLAGISIWMLIRLVRGTRARNGITTMPIWFLEVLGAMLLAGCVASWILGGLEWIFFEAVFAFGGMLFLRQKINARVRQNADLELADEGTLEGENESSPEDG
jgi:hypothetical protein